MRRADILFFTSVFLMVGGIVEESMGRVWLDDLLVAILFALFGIAQLIHNASCGTQVSHQVAITVPRKEEEK
jgi:hypothetical protein